MGGIGATEIILVLLVLVLLFGAKKLPELARGSGRALRIFKAETKGLMDDDDDETAKKTDGDTSETQTDEARRREIEGPRGPLHTDSVRTDVSYDDQPGDQR